MRRQVNVFLRRTAVRLTSTYSHNVSVAFNLGFFFPLDDDTILYNLGLAEKDRAAAAKAVRKHARAVGRLVFYCMANKIEKDGEYQTTDQRLYVNEHVFPEIYLFFLYGDVMPTSSEYPLADLVKFIAQNRLMSNDDWDWEEDKDFKRVEDGLREYISHVLVEKSTGDDSLFQLRKDLCKAAEQDFIKNRQLVLSPLKEGLSLDGSLNGACSV